MGKPLFKKKKRKLKSLPVRSAGCVCEDLHAMSQMLCTLNMFARRRLGSVLGSELVLTQAGEEPTPPGAPPTWCSFTPPLTRPPRRSRVRVRAQRRASPQRYLQLDLIPRLSPAIALEKANRVNSKEEPARRRSRLWAPRQE